jgi:uncharacterized protein (DUF362 family)
MTKALIVAFLCICDAASAVAQSAAPSPTPSIVYTIHDDAAIKDYETNAQIVRRMVNRLVTAVTGQPDVAKAWGSLVSAEDKIGIKISAAGGELFTTHHDVVNAIVDGLVSAGHRRSDIIIWDRSSGGVREAGYKPASDGYQIKSIPPHDGYDPKAMLSAPLVGKLVWGDFDYKPSSGKTVVLSETENTSSVSHFSKLLTSEVTKVINVPVMSSSETNGIAGCLYNMTIPNIDNWRRFSQPYGFGVDSIAQIYSHPLIAQKVVLNLMDGLLAQYAGGPQSQPNWALHHATLYASKDPVALDAIALKRIQEWRARASLPRIGHMADYIPIASELGLGNAAPDRIELRKIGQ